MFSKVKILFHFWRFYFLFFCFLAGGATLGARLFFLQIENQGFYRALAQGQHNFFKTLTPSRGEIFFRERILGGGEKSIPAATNSAVKSVIVSPREVQDPSSAATIISRVLKLDEEHIRVILSENSSYAILKNGVLHDLIGIFNI